MSLASNHAAATPIGPGRPSGERVVEMIHMVVNMEKKVLRLHEGVADCAGVEPIEGLLADIIAGKRQQIAQLERGMVFLKLLRPATDGPRAVSAG